MPIKETYLKNFAIVKTTRTAQQTTLFLERILKGRTKQRFIEELKKKQKAHKDHAWLSASSGWTNEIELWYEYDIEDGYFDKHPERKQEFFKYGNITPNLPWCWFVIAVITECKTGKHIRYGRKLQVSKPVIKSLTMEEAEKLF